MNEIIDNIPNILSVVAILIGIISYKVAKDSLVFNQRLILMKESYEPIFNDIKNNKEIKLNSSQKMNFDNIKKIKESYFFPVFDKRDRKFINSILEGEEKINSFKKRTDSYVSTSIERVLNAELQKKNFDQIIVRVYIEGHKEKNLYDVLLNNDITLSIVSNSPIIWCDTGEKFIAKTPEGDEYENINVTNKCQLSYLLEKYLDIRINSFNWAEDFLTDFKEYEEKIILELKNMSEYQDAEKEYHNILTYMSELEQVIIKRTRKLIIP